MAPAIKGLMSSFIKGASKFLGNIETINYFSLHFLIFLRNLFTIVIFFLLVLFLDALLPSMNLVE